MAYDPKKKREDELSLPQRIGRNTRQSVDTLVHGASTLNPLAVGARGFADAVPTAQRAVGDLASGYTNPTADNAPPVATPVRNPVVSTVGGGGSTPTGGVPASPQPDFSRVQGAIRAPAAPVLRPGDVNTFTGGNGVTRAVEPAPQAAAAPGGVARPSLAAPTIAPVMTFGNPTASESRQVQDDRHAALSALDFNDFQLRGKTTRGARDAQSDNARTRAEIVNGAARVGADLSGGNRDAAVRQNVTTTEQDASNARAVLGEQGANGRALLSDAGDTERTKLALSRPETFADASGSLLSIANGVARPITNDGKPVKSPASKTEGQITPALALQAASEELKALLENAPVTPDAAYTQRVAEVQARRDAILGGNSAAPGAPSAPGIGATRDGYQFLGGNPADPASWKKVK